MTSISSKRVLTLLKIGIRVVIHRVLKAIRKLTILEMALHRFLKISIQMIGLKMVAVALGQKVLLPLFSLTSNKNKRKNKRLTIRSFRHKKKKEKKAIKMKRNSKKRLSYSLKTTPWTTILWVKRSEREHMQPFMSAYISDTIKRLLSKYT